MFSRAIMKDVTRVMSAWNASTCRSNISSAYSRNVSGTPTGRSGTAKSLLVDSARAMRCSTSRIESRYSPSLVRSWPPSRPDRAAISRVSPSRMLRSSSTRSRRSSGVSPVPKSRSNTNRGFVSAGSGWVGVFHDIEFMYAHA